MVVFWGFFSRTAITPRKWVNLKVSGGDDYKCQCNHNISVQAAKST